MEHFVSPHSLWHTLRLFKFVMSGWIINEEAWQLRSKAPASPCTLYLRCCLSNIRTGLRLRNKEKWQDKSYHQAKGKGGRISGVQVLLCLCAAACVSVRERRAIPERQKQTSWNSGMEGTIIMQVIIHGITDLAWERERGRALEGKSLAVSLIRVIAV